MTRINISITSQKTIERLTAIKSKTESGSYADIVNTAIKYYAERLKLSP